MWSKGDFIEKVLRAEARSKPLRHIPEALNNLHQGHLAGGGVDHRRSPKPYPLPEDPAALQQIIDALEVADVLFGDQTAIVFSRFAWKVLIYADQLTDPPTNPGFIARVAMAARYIRAYPNLMLNPPDIPDLFTAARAADVHFSLMRENETGP